MPPRAPSTDLDSSVVARELEVRAVRAWLVAALGLGIALAAIHALGTGGFASGTGTGVPGEVIDERSRAGLREVLREAGQNQ